MYASFGELARERGLRDIVLKDILSLPKTEDAHVEAYLSALMDDAGCQAEVERLWLEAIGLLVDKEECTVRSPESFARVLRIMPMIPEELVNDGIVDDFVLTKVLWFIYDREEAEGRRFKDPERSFEAILVMMPPRVIYEFFGSASPQVVMRVLLNLTMGAEKFIFLLDENVLRKMLTKKENETLLNMMLELFRVMGVEFRLYGKDLDPAWAENERVFGVI